MKHWNVWQRFQTIMPYGAECASHPSPYTAETRSVAAAHLRGRDGILLGIGPGGVPEAEWLLSLVADKTRMALLTAHEPEAASLAESGFATNVGDVHEMPFRNGTFHTIWHANVLEHAFAPFIALMEMRRVAVDGALGYFVIPSFGGDEGGVGPLHVSCLAIHEWEELMRKAGWNPIDRVDQPGGGGIEAYHHFRCTAARPKGPCAELFQMLCEARSAP